jgi:hypothetical protein
MVYLYIFMLAETADYARRGYGGDGASTRYGIYFCQDILPRRIVLFDQFEHDRWISNQVA